MHEATAQAVPDLAAIREAVHGVCAGKNVARVELFGSAANGHAREESDVDLLIEFEPKANVGLFEMGALREDLEERLGHRVDLVTRNAVERSRNAIRRKAILAHLIPVYGGNRPGC